MCICVCVSGRMKTPPLDLLISHLITHSDTYFTIHSFLKAGRESEGVMRDECVSVCNQ